jgi:hypothetical protein
MAQTKFSESGDYRGEKINAVIYQMASYHSSGSSSPRGTDEDEIVDKREDRFFLDFDLEKIDSKEEFNKQFEEAKAKIPSKSPPKRSTMPTKTQDNFEKFKDAMWRKFSSSKLIQNIKKLKPKDIGMKSKREVRGFKTKFDSTDAFVVVEKTGRYNEKGEQIETIRVRDAKGKFRKKSEVFGKF